MVCCQLRSTLGTSSQALCCCWCHHHHHPTLQPLLLLLLLLVVVLLLLMHLLLVLREPNKLTCSIALLRTPHVRCTCSYGADRRWDKAGLPSIEGNLAVGTGFFMLPIAREWYTWLGFMSCNKRLMVPKMKRKATMGLVPGTNSSSLLLLPLATYNIPPRFWQAGLRKPCWHSQVLSACG